MPKKNTHPKKSHKQSFRKNHNSSSYLKKSSFFLITAIAAFICTSIFTAQPTQATCANSKSCKSDLSEKIENNTPGTFAGKTVYPPKIEPQSPQTDLAVLGISTASGEKHIFVDLSKQTLTAYQGTSQILKTFVATGKWNKTPTGNFHIWEKLVATRMAGGEGADAYDLPNVPYVMYFYSDFGLHGAYWHDNFGHTMSHGCVNMRQVDAKTLYEWAEVGTEVSICDQITDTNQCIQNNPVQK